MAKPDHDPSVFAEPHLRGGPLRPDASEARAASNLERERRGEDVRDDVAQHSVFDEVHTLPEHGAKTVEQDWSCSQCGYNLRGLPSGRPCPECGYVELYRPPPGDAASYSTWLMQRRNRTTPTQSRIAIAGVALVGGVMGVMGTFVQTFNGGLVTALPIGGLLSAIIIGPPIEEIMKIAALGMLVETRPFLIRSPSQIVKASLAAGLGFAVIENLLYLNVYIPNPTITLILWRWLICSTMHIACTMIAGRGVARVWERTLREGRPPRMDLALPAFTTAAIIHGSYNAAAIGLERIGWF